MNLNEIQAEVQKILTIDFSSETARKSNEKQVHRAMEAIRGQIRTLDRETDWLTGAGFSAMAQALTMHFGKSNWLKFEEIASELWGRAVLTVCGHYHHMVGPAMLANARCQEKLGNFDRARLAYTCVVKDFAFLVDDWISATEAPPDDDDDRMSLKCLQTSVNYLLSRGITKIDHIKLTSLKRQIDDIFARSSNDERERQGQRDKDRP